MTIQTAESMFTILGMAKDGSWAPLDSNIVGLAAALRQAQAWREAVVDFHVVVRGVDGIVWREGQVEVGQFMRINNFDVTYEGIVESTDSGVVLTSYTALYEGADGLYVAPAGDSVHLKVDDDATLLVAA